MARAARHVEEQPARPERPAPFRIVVADDHAVTRSGVRMIAELYADFEVVGEGSTGAEAVELARRLSPDLVVMDLKMPEMGGIEAIAALKEEFPDLPVLVFTVHEDGNAILEAMRAGATGYLPKSASCEDIHEAIKAVRAGDTYISPQMAGLAIKWLSRKMDEANRASLLTEVITPREREVLALLGTGLSSRSIAKRLGTGERTVNTHIGHLYRKLGVNNRVDAVLAGMRVGLVETPDVTTH